MGIDDFVSGNRVCSLGMKVVKSDATEGREDVLNSEDYLQTKKRRWTYHNTSFKFVILNIQEKAKSLYERAVERYDGLKFRILYQS